MVRPIRQSFIVMAVAGLALTAQACPQAKLSTPDAGSIKVTVEAMGSSRPIAPSQALCTPTADGKSEKVKTPRRPTIRWSGVPEGTASLAVFMMDPDVPADFTDAGKEGKLLSERIKRRDFFHYGIIHLPADATELKGGNAAQAPAVGHELVNDLGLNGYVKPSHSYGGPCPPWNDARVHHYHFIVLALDEGAPVSAPEESPSDDGQPSDGPNTAKNTFDRLIKSRHVLAKGTVIGTYTLNKDLRVKTSGPK